jgi:hypothetical protein
VATQVVVGGLDIFDHGGCAAPETSREPRSSPCRCRLFRAPPVLVCTTRSMPYHITSASVACDL